jgi:enamine deaminase RidA (YjgF/YER057c/UK114 family)
MRQKDALDQILAHKGLPALPAIPAMPGTTRWKAALAHAQALLEQAQAEIDDYIQGRSDAWQESDRADTLAAAAESLSEITEMIGQVELT